jgi:hypothetical protein
MTTVFSKTISWRSSDGEFTLTMDTGVGELLAPDGQVTRMTIAQWRDVQTALNELIGPTQFPSSRASQPNQGQAWTEESDAELRSLWQQKMPIRAIAEHFGRSRGAITARLARLGIVVE